VKEVGNEVGNEVVREAEKGAVLPPPPPPPPPNAVTTAVPRSSLHGHRPGHARGHGHSRKHHAAAAADRLAAAAAAGHDDPVAAAATTTTTITTTKTAAATTAGSHRAEPRSHRGGKAASPSLTKLQTRLRKHKRKVRHAINGRTPSSPQRPVVLAVETVFNGLGAQALRLVDAQAVADALQGDLVLHPARYWNYGCAPWRGWDCYFRPPAGWAAHAAKSPRVKDCIELAELPPAPHLPNVACVKISTVASANRAADMLVRAAVADEEEERAIGGDSGGGPADIVAHNGGGGDRRRGPGWLGSVGRAVLGAVTDSAAAAARAGNQQSSYLAAYSASADARSNRVTLPHARALASRVYHLAPSTRGRVLAMLAGAGLDLAGTSGLSQSGIPVAAYMAGEEAEKEGGGKRGGVVNGVVIPGVSQYVGVHLRRGDKQKEVRLPPVSAYVAAVEAVSPPSASVFIASDDGRALRELRRALEARGRVVLALGAASARAGHVQAVTNRAATKHNRPLVEALLAEVHALAAADWFVGTFSSNLGRLVHVLRDEKDPETSISLDTRWAPGVAYRTFGTRYCDADDAHPGYCAMLAKGGGVPEAPGAGTGATGDKDGRKLIP
jgi:hypothetical protein